MKKTKLKGLLRNWENKNKKFSYTKSMRLLDVIHYVFSDTIKKYNHDSTYHKSKYLYDEIVYEFEVIFDFLNRGKVLLAINILRNVYETILYIISTTYDGNLNVNVKTDPSDFRNVVRENCDQLFSGYFKEQDINDIYKYLSKLTHITNIKEATSYLLSKKKYTKYISNEIKRLTLEIEYMYVDFLNKKNNLSDNNFLLNSIMIANYIEQINLMYYIVDTEKESEILQIYFYGETNQNYLQKTNENLLNVLNDYKVYKDDIETSIKKVIKEFNKQIKKSNYLEIADMIINDTLNNDN